MATPMQVTIATIDTDSTTTTNDHAQAIEALPEPADLNPIVCSTCQLQDPHFKSTCRLPDLHHKDTTTTILAPPDCPSTPPMQTRSLPTPPISPDDDTLDSNVATNGPPAAHPTTNDNRDTSMETAADEWNPSTNPEDWGIHDPHETSALYPPVYLESLDDLANTLSTLLSSILPLTAIRFGSQGSGRLHNNLSQYIDTTVFRDLFREFEDYDDLAKHVSRVRDNQHRVPNCWQCYFPRLLEIRRLLGSYLTQAEAFVKNHSGYRNGLREYALIADIDYWHAESGNGVLHAHEAQYLFVLCRFLTDQHHYELARKTHQLLTSRFEHASELWRLVTTILDRLEPPSYIYELDDSFRQEYSERRRETFRRIAAH
jgi:hypothetical protein